MQKDISAFFSVQNHSKNANNNANNANNANDANNANNANDANINVYTDGACSNNGKRSAKAGWGVYFSENSHLNSYGKIDGKQTNQVAELTAVIKAYKILENEIVKNTHITIYSDSIYAIRCSTTYGEKLEKICWIKKKPIPNVQLVKKAYYLFKNKPHIKFIHIKAHTGKQDQHSLGNVGADKLANIAIANIAIG